MPGLIRHKCLPSLTVNRTWLPVLLFFQFSFSSLAQTTSQLRFENISVQQGLANSVVYSILQDRRGGLWFATDNGLSKYDGYTFTTYKRVPGDTTSLTGNSVISLLEDQEGYLWIGMMGQGLCRFDKHTETFTGFGPNKKTLQQGTIQSLVEDEERKLWVANGGPELRRFDRQTGEYSRFNFAALLTTIPNQKNYPRVNTVYRDPAGKIWVGSENGLHQMILNSNDIGKTARVTFRSFSNRTSNTSSLGTDNVREIYQDRAGVLWVITDKGLNHLDKRAGLFIPHPISFENATSNQNKPGFTFKHLCEDQQGYLWIGTNTSGLFRLDPDRTHWAQVKHDPNEPSSLSGKFVTSLLVDRSGLLWVGIWGEGIDKGNPRQQPFRQYRPIPGNSASLGNKYVDAIVEDQLGEVWIGTGAGLDRFDQQTGLFTHYSFPGSTTNGPSDRPVNALLEDRDGNLWVGSRGDLAQFNRKTGKFTSFTQDPLRFPGLGSNTSIFTLFEDRQGLIWLGTNNGIKSFDRKNGTVRQYPFDPQNSEGISDGWAIAFAEDKHGSLWVGTGSVALNRLDRKTGRFTHYRPDLRKSGRITSESVFSILTDSKGNVWFGTFGGGLCRFDYLTETFQAFTQADGLADNSITSIEEDHQGYIWLATKKGLTRFSYPDKIFINYDVNDGLQSNGYGRAHYKGRSGLLYFGGENGFTAFDPRQLTTNQHIPPVVITRIKLFDKPLIGQHDTGTLNFRFDENFFSFEFAALNFANPAKNQYAYQLVGLEKDWVYSGSRRFASYTNLTPGSYVFRVKGSNNDGVWNERGLSIQVIIHPPWWQTIWFRFLAVTILILTVLLYIRFYTRSKLARQRHEMKRVLQAQEGERHRLAADLHDDLGATLAAIKGQLELLHRTQGTLKRPISLMEKALRDLRHISHNLMPPEFANIGLTEALHETVNRAEANSGINFLFITYGQERRLDNEIELTIYRIATELIQNAIRHAQARQVTIQLIFYPEQVSLLVEDDGNGYTSSRQGKDTGIGLRNIHSRATYLKSKLLVDSGARGTTVTLEVPLEF